MATITATSMGGSGSRVVNVTTLTSSDTFTYNASANPILVVQNDTGGAVTVNIDGDGSTSVSFRGIPSVDVSGGYSTASIADGASVAIPLNTISAYLEGTIAVTGASGAEAMLLEF